MENQIDKRVHPLIRDRWSPVVFSDRPVPADLLAICLEAARWAPSSYNDQPWRFLVCDRYRHASSWRKLLETMAPGNQTWAERAPVLILAATRSNFRASDKANLHAWHDLGLATENLVLQAEALGLSGHLVAGFDRGAARRRFEVPDSFEPVSILVLGYRDTEVDLPELREREERPRERRRLDEIAFEGCWNEPFDASLKE